MHHQPTSAADVLSVVAQAAADRQTLEIQGGRSKRPMWPRGGADALLDLRGVRGVIDYDPDELILKAHAGTPLHEIETELAGRRQMLAFEPYDHGPLFGAASGQATLGGIVAANVSGSRRISAGAARDHVLGIDAVSGRGEAFKGGGAVVKNVTGFDLPKLMAGSLGTLAVLTAVTVRVLPRPETESTVLFRGLGDEAGNRLMGEALGQSAAVSGAVHICGDEALTALRIEGFGPSVAARCRDLELAARRVGACERLDRDASREWWSSVQRLGCLPVEAHDLWRVTLPPANGWRIAAVVASHAARVMYDWAGGLAWIALPRHSPSGVAAELVSRARELGGHVQLVRAGAATRAVATTLNAVPAGVAALQARVKAAFDPLGLLNPGLDPAATL